MPNESQTTIKPTKKGVRSLPAPLTFDIEVADAIEAAADSDACVERVMPDEYRVRLHPSDRFSVFRLRNRAWKIHGLEAPDARPLLCALLLHLGLAEAIPDAIEPLLRRQITDEDRKLFRKPSGHHDNQRNLAAYQAIEAKLKFLGAAQ